MTFLEKAIEIARNSEHKAHKVGCVITDRKGRIISTGWNVFGKTHPTQKKYAQKVGEYKREMLHAEIHALVRCRETPHSIYVARLTGGGAVGAAAPCKICRLAIREAGIPDRNIYST